MEWLLACLTLAVLGLTVSALGMILMLRSIARDGQALRDAVMAGLREYAVEDPPEAKEVRPDPNLGWHE